MEITNKLNSNNPLFVLEGLKELLAIGEHGIITEDALAPLVQWWILMNITTTDIQNNTISVEWNMDKIGDTEDDGCYINNGELTCVITHNNLLALINNHWGDFEIEGDYILHWNNEYEDYQLNWEKQSTHRYEKKENGVLYHHKSLFVPNHGTGWCLMYPLSILPLLKEVSCTPTMADIEIYGAERASYCHRITNYSEIPEWIEANQELGYFKAS